MSSVDASLIRDVRDPKSSDWEDVMTNVSNYGHVPLKVRHKMTLPKGQDNVIAVARYSAGWYGLILLVLAAAAFVGGVAAGTSGWYRDNVNALADASGLPSGPRAALLAPDRADSEAPSMADAIAALVQRLEKIEDEQRAALAEREELLADYVDATVDATASIAALREAMLKASADSAAAKSSVDELRDVIDAAHRARLDQANRLVSDPQSEQ